MTQPDAGREFFKLSGSGNDFVFFDARVEPAGVLAEPPVVAALCARGTGIGADGVVFLEPSAIADFRIRYLNSDGTEASLCGNASLCAGRLAVELGAAQPARFSFETGAGVVHGRVRDGRVEIELQPVAEVKASLPEVELAAGEQRVGFARVGVPHVVVLREDLDRLDVSRRGTELRWHSSLSHGANVNFLSEAGKGAWHYRTFERGVEAETLACGTGAVACAVLLARWGASGGELELVPPSGRALRVRLERRGEELIPTLAGEARLVFRGILGEYA
jgi:diaminopimelate epimerase